MRSQPSILHLDLDAFFAAVEQRDKPSLRGKPVVVGGLGPRGVVSTASYEARAYGVRSAMRTAESRARCPHAAYLSGRFDAYRESSRAVIRALREITDVIEPLSLDEAFVDLAAPPRERSCASAADSPAPDAPTGPGTAISQGRGAAISQGRGAAISQGRGAAAYDSSEPEPDAEEVYRIAVGLKQRVREVTGGLTASVGVGTSKLIAKIASDLEKPDGLTVVVPGTELDFLHPMPVTVIPGVGPSTTERLRRLGVRTVADLDRVGEDDLVALLGQAHGRSLARLAHAQDDRAVEPVRESKSVSVEDTFDRDIADPVHLGLLLTGLASRVAERLAEARTSGRTVTVKVRLFDFSTHTRSATLPGPTDDPGTITRLARRLLDEVRTVDGVRLLGVGVSGLADWVQDDLFGWIDAPSGMPSIEAGGARMAADGPASPADGPEAPTDGSEEERATPEYAPGSDVVHREHGPGWVWGSGLGRVTVRFETALTQPGPVRTFRLEDPDLNPARRSAAAE